jgi:hypothetical protein
MTASGAATGGAAVGIIMLDTVFPGTPGQRRAL